MCYHMKRKEFIKKSAVGIGTFTIVPTMFSSCGDDEVTSSGDPEDITCDLTPEEPVGPFPIKNPTQLIQNNIVGNREGVSLTIRFELQDKNNDCKPIEGLYVDIWHCDSQGNYSEYDGQLNGDFGTEDFLRGRQMSNAEGMVSFESIYPGWYPGRAPHIHLEILDMNGNSLFVTQVGFPEDKSLEVYSTVGYNENPDTNNERDNVLSDQEVANLSGGIQTGFVLTKTLVIEL